MKRYPEYKDSGVEWIGKIPDGWNVSKLKYLANVRLSNVDKKSKEGEETVLLCNYTDVYYNEYIESELNFMEATASADQAKRFHLQEGDVMITKDSESPDDIAVPAYVPRTLRGVLCGYHLAHIKPKPEFSNGEYLFRAFLSPQINAQLTVAANGITRYGIGRLSIDNTLFAVPPAIEQKQIAKFLNHKTHLLDTLIAKKQRQIELLQEQRAAIINQAVTKGLDPSVPMKDSGIPWLGKVPAHWEVLSLRRIVTRFVDYRGKTPTKTESGVPLITAKNIKMGKIVLDLSREYISEETYRDWMVRGFPEVGDVLVTTEAPLGEVAQVVDARIALAQRIILLKCGKKRVDEGYVRYLFLSEFGQAELLRQATGSTAKGIKASKFKGIFVVLPTKEEQREAASYLELHCNRIEQAISRQEKAIELLQEYRTTLISEVVTGKIDVREEVINNDTTRATY